MQAREVNASRLKGQACQRSDQRIDCRCRLSRRALKENVLVDAQPCLLLLCWRHWRQFRPALHLGNLEGNGNGEMEAQ